MKDIFFENLGDWNLEGYLLSNGFSMCNASILLLNEEVREAYYHQDEQLFKGDDYGPNAAWCWANGNQVQVFSDLSKMKALRTWGYIFRDYSRLSDWGILNMGNFKWRREPNECKGTLMHHDLPRNHDEYCTRLKWNECAGPTTTGLLPTNPVDTGGAIAIQSRTFWPRTTQIRIRLIQSSQIRR